MHVLSLNTKFQAVWKAKNSWQRSSLHALTTGSRRVCAVPMILMIKNVHISSSLKCVQNTLKEICYWTGHIFPLQHRIINSNMCISQSFIRKSSWVKMDLQFTYSYSMWVNSNQIHKIKPKDQHLTVGKTVTNCPKKLSTKEVIFSRRKVSILFLHRNIHRLFIWLFLLYPGLSLIFFYKDYPNKETKLSF